MSLEFAGLTREFGFVYGINREEDRRESSGREERGRPLVRGKKRRAEEEAERKGWKVGREMGGRKKRGLKRSL